MMNSTARVIESYTVAYPDPIKLKEGDSVQIEKWEPKDSEWAGWAFCVDQRGVKGWVSEKYLQVNGSEACVISDYDATELDVQAGEDVKIHHEEFGWAWVENAQGAQGWVPLKNLEAKRIEQPRIETRRLILEPYRDQDLEDIFSYASQSEVTRFLTWPAHKTLDDSRNFLKWVQSSTRNEAGNLFFVFAIRLKETGKVIGSVDIKNPQPWISQIDYVLARDHWGNGLMPEAAEALKNWSFETFPEIVRFQAFCDVENKASVRVMKKIGMKFEGIQKKSFKVQERLVDLAHYALVRGEDGLIG